MAIKCPNKSHQDYISLVEKYGENKAKLLWQKDDYTKYLSDELITSDQREELIQSENSFIVKDEDGRHFSSNETQQITDAIRTNIYNQFQELDKQGKPLNVNESFEIAKEDLTYLRDTYEWLLDEANTQEEIDEVINEYIDDVGFLKGVSLEEAKSRLNFFNRVIQDKTWDQFIQQTVQSLGSLGLKVKGNLLNPDNVSNVKADNNEEVAASELLTDEGGYERTSWEDSAVFTLDHKDTASWRVKMMLADIKKPEESNVLGLATHYSFDSLYDELKQLFAHEPVISFEKYTDKLKGLSNKEGKKHYKQIISKLLDPEVPQRIKNEFISVLSSNYNEFMMMLWSEGKEGFSLRPIKSNQSAVTNRIIEFWYEGFKASEDLVIEQDGKLFLDSDEINRLDQLRIDAQKGDLAAKRDASKKILKSIGIEMSDGGFEAITRDTTYTEFKSSIKAKKFDKQFANNGLFGFIIDALKDSLGVEYDIENRNPFVGQNAQSAVRFLANVEASYSEAIYSNSHKNSERKTIYSYGYNTFETHRFKRLKFNKGYASSLLGSKFAAKSHYLSKILAEDPAFMDNFNFYLLDGLRKERSFQEGITRSKMSDNEMELTTIGMFQNQGKNFAYYWDATHSDKSTTPVISVQKVDIGDISIRDGRLHNIGRSEVFRHIYEGVLGEIDRIVDTANKINEGKIDELIAKFGKAYPSNGIRFWTFPSLNKFLNIQEGILKNPGELSGSELQGEIRNALLDEINSIIDTTITNWKESGLVNVAEGTTKFDKDYFKGYANINEGILLTAADLELNYLLHNMNMMQLITGDPALSNKNVDRVGVDGVLAEYQKRGAKDMAPRSDLDWGWTIESKTTGNKYTPTQNANYIWLADFNGASLTEGLSKLNPAFGKKYDTHTDAQELKTVKETVNVLMAQGRISDDMYSSIMDTIDAAPEGNYTLTDKQLKVVMQPDKPIYVWNKVKDGVDKIYYVKSSSFPLIPQLTKGTSLDNLRIAMETNNIDRAAFESSTKMGAENITSVFNDDGSYQSVEEITNKIIPTSLDRSGFGIQMEVPYDPSKNKIVTISQMNKLLFDGLLETTFNFKGIKIDGKTLKTIKENIRIQMFEKAESDLYNRLGVKLVGKDNFEVLDTTKLQNAIQEEAISRNWSPNAIDAIRVNDNGEISVPYAFSTVADKIESLLLSLFSNSIIKQKMPGKSFVQGTSQGIRSPKVEAWSQEQFERESGITWIKDAEGNSLFDAEKGLTFITIDEQGKTHEAQILLPFKFWDGDKLLDVNNFVDEDGYLDNNKLPEELLSLIAARIPNQGHSSQLAVKVVGFLPKALGDLVLVPTEITQQMGSDFDVDKLYTYMFNSVLGDNGKLYKVPDTYNIDKEGNFTIDSEALETWRKEVFMETGGPAIKELEMKVLQNAYIDIHKTILTSPEGIEKCAQSLDKEDLGQTAPEVTKVKDTYLSRRRQIEDFISQRAGKEGVAMYSRAAVASVVLQDPDLNIRLIRKDREGKPVTLPFRLIKGIDLTHLSGVANSDFRGETRSKTDNVITQQSAAVDNAKDPKLDNNNLNAITFDSAIALSQLQTAENKAVSLEANAYLMQQPIIRRFVKVMQSISDSLTKEFIPNKKEAVIDKLLEEFESPEWVYEDYQNLRNPEDPNMRFTIDELKDMIDNPDIGDEAYNANQLKVLSHFSYLFDVGEQFRDILTALSTDSKGLPKNGFEAVRREEQILEIDEKPNVIGQEAIFGEVVSMTSGTRTPLDEVNTIYLTPKTESGKVATYVTKAANFLNKFFPYKSKVVATATEFIEYESGKLGNGKSNVNADFRRKVWNSIKSWIYSSDKLFLYDKQTLLYDTKESIARRVQKLKGTEFGKNNFFLQRINTDITDNPKIPDFIKYKAAIGERTDEINVVKGLLDLLTHENEEYRQIGEDMIHYEYIMGGIQGANEYIKYIPTAYLNSVNFGDNIKEFMNKLDNAENFDVNSFVEQYFRNNPGDAVKLTENTYKQTAKGTLVIDNKRHDDDYKNLTYIQSGELITRKYTSFKDGNKWKLFKLSRIDTREDGISLVYETIDTLGPINIDKKRMPAWSDYSFASNSVSSSNVPVQTSTTGKISNPNVAEINIDNYKVTKADDLLNTVELAGNKELAEFFRTNFASLLGKVQIKNLTQHPEYSSKKSTSKGLYDNINKILYLNYNLLENADKASIEWTILHEMSHAVTVAPFYKKATDLSKVESKFVAAIKTTQLLTAIKVGNDKVKLDDTRFDFAVKELLNSFENRTHTQFLKANLPEDVDLRETTDRLIDKYYGLINEREFLAQTFSSSEFQKYLNSISAVKDKSVFEQIIDSIYNYLKSIIQATGIKVDKNSVLEETLRDLVPFIESISDTKVVEQITYGEAKLINGKYYQVGYDIDGKPVTYRLGSDMNNLTDVKGSPEAVAKKAEDVDKSIKQEADELITAESDFIDNLGMRTAEFVKSLSKEQREAFRFALNKGIFKIKC